MPCFCVVISGIRTLIRQRLRSVAEHLPEWADQFQAVTIWIYVDDIILQIDPRLAPLAVAETYHALRQYNLHPQPLKCKCHIPAWRTIPLDQHYQHPDSATILQLGPFSLVRTPLESCAPIATSHTKDYPDPSMDVLSRQRHPPRISGHSCASRSTAVCNITPPSLPDPTPIADA